MNVIYHRIYHLGYSGWHMPRLLRRMIAKYHADFAKHEDVNGALQKISDMVSLALAKQDVLT